METLANYYPVSISLYAYLQTIESGNNMLIGKLSYN